MNEYQDRQRAMQIAQQQLNQATADDIANGRIYECGGGNIRSYEFDDLQDNMDKGLYIGGASWLTNFKKARLHQYKKEHTSKVYYTKYQWFMKTFWNDVRLILMGPVMENKRLVDVTNPFSGECDVRIPDVVDITKGVANIKFSTKRILNNNKSFI